MASMLAIYRGSAGAYKLGFSMLGSSMVETQVGVGIVEGPLQTLACTTARGRNSGGGLL